MKPKLTITASNRDRFDPDTNATKLFVKSIQWQTYKDFELLIADGGSKNYEEIKKYIENFNGDIPMRIVQFEIDLFSRSFLNNLGIRNAKGEYIATTDVDMLYDKYFVSEVMENAGRNVMIESRTMYWKQPLVQRIYNGELNPYTNIDDCKRGRIKKRTSAGGFQMMHIDSWQKLHAFDERYKVWGSEDYDLLLRAGKANIKVKWIGETIDNIKLFHQPHLKKDIKMDLEWQKKNQKFLHNITNFVANQDGYWGGIQD